MISRWRSTFAVHECMNRCCHLGTPVERPSHPLPGARGKSTFHLRRQVTKITAVLVLFTILGYVRHDHDLAIDISDVTQIDDVGEAALKATAHRAVAPTENIRRGP